tara:strand:+ start:7196 stop:9802 length:2607 start_codon:yes stop_codon:yes gene_type:complete
MSPTFVNLDPSIVDELATRYVVTPNERLARAYRAAYDDLMLSQGHRVWTTLRCTSLAQYHRYLLRELMDTTSLEIELVDDLIAQLRFIQAAPPDASHLASTALEAWQLCHRYGIPLDHPGLQPSRLQPFVDWCRRVAQQFNEAELINAQIPTLLLAHPPAVTPDLVLVDFEHLSPMEEQLLHWQMEHGAEIRVLQRGEISAFKEDAIPAAEPPAATRPASVQAFSEFQEELAAAAQWCQDIRANAPESTIGVVVPNLMQHYAAVQRQFAVTLNPGSGSLDMPFDLSGGQPLASQPVWQHARIMLNWAIQPLDQASLQPALTSPYLALAEFRSLVTEWPRTFRRRITLSQAGARLEVEADPSPLLTSAGLLADAGKRTLKHWVQGIRSLLQATGWPNTSRLGSVQYQAAQQVLDMLTHVEGLYGQEPISNLRAFELLDHALAGRAFGSQRAAQPIQILGLLETTGLEFDYLWVMGMGANTFPAQSHRNPYLPAQLAASFGLPRSTQEQELAFARRLLGHWATSSGHLQLSYVNQDNGMPVAPSALMLRTLNADLAPQQAGASAEQAHQRLLLRNPGMHPQTILLEDRPETLPGLLPPGKLQGGVSRLEDQARCPFRAFALYRLGLKKPLPPRDFLDLAERGILIHQVLERLLTNVPDSQALAALTQEQVEALCRRSIREYRHLPVGYAETEVSRVVALVTRWLDLEAKRRPFSIVGVERKFELTLAEMTFTLKIDRIDQVDDVRVVLDYKTGEANIAGARGDQPQAPQLPAYSLISDQVQGIYYAQLKTSTVKINGLASEAATLVANKASGISVIHPDHPWSEQVGRWRLHLAQLTLAIRQGAAQVTPSGDICQRCHLHSLCRIRERQS